jgi:acyl-CoA reductase-like NAD-dependent aldehyde dehydrogenase
MATNKLKVLTAYDEILIKELPYDGPKKAEKALATARSLADDRNKWLTGAERIQILERAKQIVEERYDELVKTSAMEGGKPLVDTRAEVTRAISGISVAIEEIGKLTGKEIAMNVNSASLNRMAYTFMEPIGVVVAICAFNHPFNLGIHQVVTAVAAGCPVIIKPASTTPLSAINLVKILHDSGLPREWAQVLITNNQVAEQLVTDSRVDYMTFIGSGRVGWYLKSKLAPGTRCALEHGGSSPVIFEADADIDDALPLLAKGGLYHAGQVCVSVQRLFAHQKVSKKIVSGLPGLQRN